MADPRRAYAHCAKGGHEMPPLPGIYVCTTHVGTPGPTTHCAVCGVAVEDGCWVCGDHLVRPVNEYVNEQE